MRTSLLTAAILMMSLIMPASAGPLTAQFSYKPELSAQRNYQLIAELADATCRKAMRRSDTLVTRLSDKPREACAADLISGAIEQFDLPELTEAYSLAHPTHFAELEGRTQSSAIR